MKRIIAIAEASPNSCQILFVDVNKLDLNNSQQRKYLRIVEQALLDAENEGTICKSESFSFGDVWLEDALTQSPCKVMGSCILKVTM